MFGKAKGSPKTRKIEQIDELAARLETFVLEVGLKDIDVRALVPPELWDSYWAKRDLVEANLFEAQAQAAVIKKIIEQALSKESGPRWIS